VLFVWCRGFFVYLETLSIPGYILAALHTRKLHSIEAGLKYLMMGAFASSFLLLGITLIYGLAGSLDFETLQGVLMDLSSQEKLLVSVSTVILLSSFAFKVALIPFHMWAPDVYQGAPTGVAAFLGSTTKVALFGAILISFERSGFFGFLLTKQFFVLFGALSIVMGSLLAISQKSIKRMLAYSGIVHVGYVALVSARGESSLGAVAYYLAVYSITFIGALWCVHQLEKQNGAEKKDILITELTALSLKAKLPTLISLAFFLFSLAGIPPLPGFFVKYLLLKELFTHGNLFSFTLILVGTFFGLAYYLRCLIPLFFHDKIWERGALLQSQTTKCNGLSWVGVIIAVMTFGLLAFASFFDSWGSFVAATTAR
jgi:NADH-quinone oxidoreductase subunit N